MIITIANGAGGAAKSILADNLATLRTLAGHKVILFDNDPQLSSLKWSCERRSNGHPVPIVARKISGKGLQPELENLRCHYQDIVIDSASRDCMGSRSALLAAHVAVIAVDLDQLDQLHEEELLTRVENACACNPGLRILVVMTSVQMQPSAEKIALVRNFSQKFKSAQLFSKVIHSGYALQLAYRDGLSISEYLPADHLAVAGMQELFGAVFATH